MLRMLCRTPASRARYLLPQGTPTFQKRNQKRDEAARKTRPMWHVLQLSDVLDLELATALAEHQAERQDVVLWQPDRRFMPLWLRYSPREYRLADTSLRVCSFPLQRGYARLPWAAMDRAGRRLARRIARTCDAERSTLVCTTPHFAAVAEHWPGRVVYWLTDLIAAYDSADPERIAALDRRMCAVADLVCPNSERIAEYLEHNGCHREKIQVLPNATRARNVLPRPALHAGALPAELSEVRRPVAGVIGNLAENMDWVLLEESIAQTPAFRWVFVGPADMPIADREAAAARERVMQHARTYFVGPRLYADLVHYARAFDVAVLPYLKREPTFSGSSTRFYEHLAACRPMVATPGVYELLGKRDLLQMVETPQQMADSLSALHEDAFDDGLADVRWRSSGSETWSHRAALMARALEQRSRGTVAIEEVLDPASPLQMLAS